MQATRPLKVPRPLARPELNLVASIEPTLDFGYPFLALFCLLFQLQFGAPLLLLFILVTIAYAALRPQRLLATLKTSAFIFAIPGIAMTSTLWSIDPAATVRASVQLGITFLAATAIASARNSSVAILGLAAATGLHTLVSMSLGHSVMSAGEAAFSGLNGGKNAMAQSAGVAALSAAAAVVIAWLRRDARLLVAALVGVLVALYVVFIAKSAGTLVSITLALGAFLTLSAFSGFTRTQRLVATVMLLLVALPILVNLSSIAEYMTDIAFKYFKKDATLSGRVYLWYRAEVLINESPLLGRGYYGFWRQGNIDAEGLWLYFGIVNRSGFNFHNAFFENVVNLGYLGFSVIAASVAAGLAALALCMVRRPSVAVGFWTAYSLYELSRVSIEALGPLPFSPPTLLLASAFSVAAVRLAELSTKGAEQVGPPRRARAQRVARQPRPLHAGARNS